MAYIFVILFVIELIYFRIADKYNIIDKPNARSSHTTITIRGGGILFPLAAIISYLSGDFTLLPTIAITLVGLISFIDDIRPLHQLPRFLSHLVAVLLIVYDLDILENIALIPVVLICTIGWINAFNFMDGINGITVLYSFVSIISFAFIFKDSDSFVALLIMAMACFVFAIFNVRKKAKTFAGDVGSISMAIFLAYFMIKLIFEESEITYLLFFSIYGIDAIITIIYRLSRKENIFLPHRTHLYQYLANEFKWPHVLVSGLYAISQLIVNVFTIYLIESGMMNFIVFITIGVLLAALYMLIRYATTKRMYA